MFFDSSTERKKTISTNPSGLLMRKREGESGNHTSTHMFDITGQCSKDSGWRRIWIQTNTALSLKYLIFDCKTSFFGIFFYPIHEKKGNIASKNQLLQDFGKLQHLIMDYFKKFSQRKNTASFKQTLWFLPLCFFCDFSVETSTET